MWPFTRRHESSDEIAADEHFTEELREVGKRRQESPEEIALEEPVNREIRDVGWGEFDKEADLEATSNLGTAALGPLAIMGARAGRRKRDSDSVDEQSQRESLQDDNEKT